MGDCKQCGLDCTKAGNGKLPPVTSMYYILTEDCNLACKYCYLNKNPHRMTLDVAMDATRWIIDQAEKARTTPQTNFFGGEPTIMWDEIIVPVTEWVRNVYKKPFQLGITTNGVLMTEERLDYAKRNGLGMLLSIDGPKEIQDRNRPLRGGGSSFDIIAPRIPLFLKHYPHLTFRATFDHEDKDTLIPTHRFAIEQGYDNIFCIPNNLSQWSPQDLEDMRGQVHDLVDYWISVFREGKTISFMPLDRSLAALARLGQAKEQGIHRQDMGRTGRLGYGKCGTGATGFVSVNYKGDIYACQELVVDGPEFRVGSIYTGVEEGRRLHLARQFDIMKVRSSAEGRCTTCRLDPICDGGCVANNFIRSGDWHVLPETSCVYYETALIEMERMHKILTEENNQQFKAFFDRYARGTHKAAPRKPAANGSVPSPH